MATLTCSNCGMSQNIRADGLAAAITSGWNSYGSALYCPDCSSTWDKRNRGRPMAGVLNTAQLIAERLVESCCGTGESCWTGWDTSSYIGVDDTGEPRYARRRFFRCKKCRYGSVVRTQFCPGCGRKMGLDNREGG